MKRRTGKIILAAALAATLLLTGCSSAPSSSAGASSEAGSSSEAAAASKEGEKESGAEKLKISFWHSMSGNNQGVLEEIVSGFNASQEKYEVVAENQGTYDESTGKFFNMANGEGSAQIIQIGEQNLQSMIDSGMIDSMTDLIENYSYDDSDLLEQVVNFYTVSNTLYAMPFNCSSPVVYYNADVFKTAGYETLPTTFEGLTEAAAKVRETSPNVTPVGMYAYGYALDQMVTNMGGFTINNSNGRSERATEAAYQDQITKIFNWVAGLRDAEQMVNYGTDGTVALSAFTQGEIGMFISTSANCRNVIDSAEFQVGVAVLPVPEGTEAQGVYAGGGALCVANSLDDAMKAGVMEFMKYATSAEVQAKWAAGTGYFPICKKAYETDSMKDAYQQYPQLKVACDQLLNSKVNEITAGPLLSQLPQLRTDLASAEESVFGGGDVKTAIDGAVSSTNAAIESANAGVGQ